MGLFSGISSVVKSIGGALSGIAGSPLTSTLLTAGAEGLFAKRQADKQMDYQQMMSDTSYQRRVKDLRAAGMNPILAATDGGASTPGGAMASVNLANSAKIGAIVNQELKNLRATEKNIDAQTNKLYNEMDILGEQFHSARADAAYAKKKANFFREGNVPGDMKFWADQIGVDPGNLAALIQSMRKKGGGLTINTNTK